MRSLVSILLFLFSIQIASAASFTGGIPIREDLFWSEEELSKVDFTSPLTEEERDYYENTHIYVVTASPSEPVYVFFGHAGIVVATPDIPEVMFDYGTFRFNDGFYTNFIFGRLYYSVIESYASFRYDDFIATDRTIKKIELMLTPEEKKAVIGFLAYNVLPENETYLYHYYKDNCATRLRDIYNAATDGKFREWAESIDTGKSFRAWSTPYMSRSLFFAFILNYLQGPSIDEPVSLYEACFLPDVLLEAIEEYEGITADTIYQTKTREDTPERYSLAIHSLPISIAFGIIIMLSASKRKGIRILSDIIAGFAWLFMGVLALVLLFMMAFTNHDVTYGNWNILIISPFVLALSILHFSSCGRREKRKSIGGLSRLMLITVVSMFIIKGCLLDIMIENNIAFYIFAIIAYSAEYAVSVLSSYRSARSSRPRYVLGQ